MLLFMINNSKKRVSGDGSENGVSENSIQEGVGKKNL